MNKFYSNISLSKLNSSVSYPIHGHYLHIQNILNLRNYIAKKQSVKDPLIKSIIHNSKYSAKYTKSAPNFVQKIYTTFKHIKMLNTLTIDVLYTKNGLLNYDQIKFFIKLFKHIKIKNLMIYDKKIYNMINMASILRLILKYIPKIQTVTYKCTQTANDIIINYLPILKFLNIITNVGSLKQISFSNNGGTIHEHGFIINKINHNFFKFALIVFNKKIENSN